MEGLRYDEIDGIVDEEGVVEDGEYDICVMGGFGYGVREGKGGKRGGGMDEVGVWIR